MQTGIGGPPVNALIELDSEVTLQEKLLIRLMIVKADDMLMIRVDEENIDAKNKSMGKSNTAYS